MGKTYHPDTVIIGAGAAGIWAGKTIEQHNRSGKIPPNNYVILEANDHIGGRVVSHRIELPNGESMMVDGGAQWLHSDEDERGRQIDNPMVSEARKFDALTLDNGRSQIYVNGARVHSGSGSAIKRRGKELVDGFKGSQDTNLDELLAPVNPNDSVVLSNSYGRTCTGAALWNSSAEDANQVVGGCHGYLLKHGMASFLTESAKEVAKHVQLSNPITRICWKPEGRKGVDVYTANGDVYHAKKCILTVSVGVLKSGNIKFEPELPEEHREHLKHVRMGKFNKVFLVFDSEFRFPENANTHLEVRTRDISKARLWTKHASTIKAKDLSYLIGDNNRPLVTCCMGGHLAKLCDQHPEEAKELAIRGLCEIWEKLVPRRDGDEPIHDDDAFNRARHIRDHVIATHVTGFGKEPHILGGYSVVDVGHYNARAELAKPIGDSLYLAGEACGAFYGKTKRDWATHVTGAALSGVRAANQALGIEEKVEQPGTFTHAAVIGRETSTAYSPGYSH